MSTPVVTGNDTGLPDGTLIADTANADGAKVQLVQLDILTGPGGASSPVTALNPLPVTGTFTPPVGGATSAKQDTGNTSLASIDTKTPGLVTGRVPVDGSGVTQPVSGTVAITGSIAVTGTFWQVTQPISAAALPLPSGAATDSNVTNVVNSLAPFGDSGAGGYIRQDSTATIAKETGGNLATLTAKDFATSAKQDTGNTSLASIDTTLARLPIAQNTLNSTSIYGPLMQALVSDSPESYTPGYVQPLSITSEGRVRASVVIADIDRAWTHTFDNPWPTQSAWAGNIYE